jgi:fructokinase
MLSAVGDDALGVEAISAAALLGIDTSLVATVDVPTCVVEVVLDAAGSPTYSIPARTSWDEIVVDDETLRSISAFGANYFCFGGLELRGEVARHAVLTVLDTCQFDAVLFDVTLRRDYTAGTLAVGLENCSIAKMNAEEAATLDLLFDCGGGPPERLLPALAQRFGIDVVCITLGEHGALIGSESEVLTCRGYATPVAEPAANSVGAGDAFSAGLVTRLHAGASLADACDFGARLGALVASRAGAVPRYTAAEVARLRPRL